MYSVVLRQQFILLLWQQEKNLNNNNRLSVISINDSFDVRSDNSSPKRQIKVKESDADKERKITATRNITRIGCFKGQFGWKVAKIITREISRFPLKCVKKRVYGDCWQLMIWKCFLSSIRDCLKRRIKLKLINQNRAYTDWKDDFRIE